MGGNAANFDLPVLQSVDSKFLAEDVANLAMLSYKEAIMDRSFFTDGDLVNQYFQYCPDVQELFSDLFGM